MAPMVGPPAYCRYLLLKRSDAPIFTCDFNFGTLILTWASTVWKELMLPVTRGLSHKNASCHLHTILNPTFFIISLFPNEILVDHSGVLKPVTKISLGCADRMRL